MMKPMFNAIASLSRSALFAAALLLFLPSAFAQEAEGDAGLDGAAAEESASSSDGGTFGGDFPSFDGSDGTFGGGFGDSSFGGGFGDSSFGDSSFGGGFGDSSFGGGFASSPFTFSLEAGLTARGMLGYLDADDLSDTIFIDPSARLKFGYSNGKAEFDLSIRADIDTIQLYPADILEEFTARAYIGDFVIEAGKMKVVWGKGDEVHVVDLFNANDYTDFIFPRYVDRRLAEPMVRVAWSGVNLRAEAIYTPMMTADRYATSGPWTPGLYTDLTSTVGSLISLMLGSLGSDNSSSSLISSYLSDSSLYDDLVNSLVDDYIPDTNSFEYGQLGARLTGTAGPVDLGVSYYFGHYKQPSINYATLTVQYDRLHSFGIEAAAALGPFNLRGEFAYYLTDDFKGTNPGVRNNSLNWVAGFDVNLPLHNININIQDYGYWIINSDGIASSLDTEYNTSGYYSNNKIAVQISDTFLRDRLSIAIKAVIGIERHDYIIMPEITFAFTPELTFTASGMYITGDDTGEFDYWHDNSFVQLGVKYVF